VRKQRPEFFVSVVDDQTRRNVRIRWRERLEGALRSSFTIISITLGRLRRKMGEKKTLGKQRKVCGCQWAG